MMPFKSREEFEAFVKKHVLVVSEVVDLMKEVQPKFSNASLVPVVRRGDIRLIKETKYVKLFWRNQVIAYRDRGGDWRRQKEAAPWREINPELPFSSVDDMLNYLRENILTSKEVVELFAFTRQNLPRLIENKSIVPIKESGRIMLFWRKEVETWKEKTDAYRELYPWQFENKSKL